jgi:AraC-like DNA-binding protein
MAGREYAVDATPAQLSIIRISDAYLRQAIKLAGALPPAKTDSEQIQVALRSIVPALLEPSGSKHSGLRRQVANAVAETFQTSTQGSPSAATHTSKRFVPALTYLHEHAREPVGVADVAAAVGLTTRGVQQLFQREIGRTPTEVLRTVRLEGARAEIQDAGPEKLIGEIARSWQFRHLGRFANLYRQTYGETPSDTLRHRDGRADPGQ